MDSITRAIRINTGALMVHLKDGDAPRPAQRSVYRQERKIGPDGWKETDGHRAM